MNECKCVCPSEHTIHISHLTSHFVCALCGDRLNSGRRRLATTVNHMYVCGTSKDKSCLHTKTTILYSSETRAPFVAFVELASARNDWVHMHMYRPIHQCMHHIRGGSMKSARQCARCFTLFSLEFIFLQFRSTR